MYVVLTPRHMGGVATEVSAQEQSAEVQYEATQVTTANKIDFSGKTKYAIQVVNASKLSSVLQGRFLKYDYVNGGLTYVMIGYPSNATSTENSGYTSVTDICDHMNDKEGPKYTFTFNAALPTDEIAGGAPARRAAKKAPAAKSLKSVKKGNLAKNGKFVSEKLYNR